MVQDVDVLLTVFFDIVVLLSCGLGIFCGICILKKNYKYLLNIFLSLNNIFGSIGILFIYLSFGIIISADTVLYLPYLTIYAVFFLILGLIFMILCRNILLYGKSEKLYLKKSYPLIIGGMVIIIINILWIILFDIYPMYKYESFNFIFDHFGDAVFFIYCYIAAGYTIYGFYKVYKNSKGIIKKYAKYFLLGNLLAHFLSLPFFSLSFVFTIFSHFGSIIILLGFIFITICFISSKEKIENI